MDTVLTVILFVLLAAIGFLLWQIWNHLNSLPRPDDQPLDEEQAKYITDRLDWLKYLLIAEAVLFTIRIVLLYLF